MSQERGMTNLAVSRAYGNQAGDDLNSPASRSYTYSPR